MLEWYFKLVYVKCHTVVDDDILHWFKFSADRLQIEIKLFDQNCGFLGISYLSELFLNHKNLVVFLVLFTDMPRGDEISGRRDIVLLNQLADEIVSYILIGIVTLSFERF